MHMIVNFIQGFNQNVSFCFISDNIFIFLENFRLKKSIFQKITLPLSERISKIPTEIIKFKS